MSSLKNRLFLLTVFTIALTTYGCSAVDTEGDGNGSGIDGGSLDGSTSDGGAADAIILDGGCTPGTPISHEDPCLVCSCGDDGVATCEPATAGTVCATQDCCLQATTCESCEGEDCPVSGMACTGDALFSCEDGNSCTEDRASCTDGVCECVNAPAENGAECVFDANACTVGDSCQDGACVQGEEADTEDGNPCTAGVCVPSDDTIRVVSSPDLGSFEITCIQPGPFRRCTSSPVRSLHSFGSVRCSWPSSHQTLCWCAGHPDPAERVAQRLRHAGLDLARGDAAAGRRCASLPRYMYLIR